MESGAASLTAALERLPGVVAATPIDTPAGLRLYLATSAAADAEAVADAATAIAADHGYDCPRDRVHVAAAPRSVRGHTVLAGMALDRLELHRVEQRAECSITIRAAHRMLHGVATEPDTPGGRTRAAVRATLLAAQSLDADLQLGIEGVRVVDPFGHRTVLVLIEAVAGRSRALLSGSALVESSEEEAAALAALGALRSWTL